MPQWAVGSGPGERNNASEMDCLAFERESGPPPAACLLDWIHIHSSILHPLAVAGLVYPAAAGSST